MSEAPGLNLIWVLLGVSSFVGLGWLMWRWGHAYGMRTGYIKGWNDSAMERKRRADERQR
jgi:hypothetical protein